jgi:gamma-glutamyltranspeptidase/glutathione hydrolase
MAHWWIEALRGAFADRAAYLGDPDYVDVPVDRLLAPETIAARRVEIGEVARADLGPARVVREGGETTHLSVLDPGGNAVSLTTTLNTTFGSGILVRGGGFLLNDEMDDFAPAGGRPNVYGLVGGAANAVQPGKRPLSSMTPVVVRAGGHANTLVLGSPGGPRIITSVTQVLLRVLVLGESLQRAVAAPRLHQQWSPPETLFEPGFDPRIVEGLERQFGHPVRRAETRFGSVQAIQVDRIGGLPVAVSDPRRGGSAGVTDG